MRLFTADLHVHTALSPCAADEMTPPRIVAEALREGLDMIAVCDHNSARNVAAVQAAAGARLAVLAGMEITSAEECHVLGLFPDAAAAEAAADEAGATLPPVDDGYVAFFGAQTVLDAGGAPAGAETRALAMATALDVDQVVALVHGHGGLAVAAHIDRKAFGVIGQLGVFPAETGFDAVELSRHVAPGSARERELSAFGLAVLRSSDSHFPEDLGAARTKLALESASFAELRLALRGEQGRRVGRA